jgi:gamma-glutamyl:cysteine ligase YbdK (ATP-grasp superfamily)
MNRLNAFSAYGIELEYMIVDHDTLDIRPVADRVLESAVGKLTSDFESGPITWSNELALHVIELKGTDPTLDLVGLADSLQSAIGQLQPALSANGVSLLPTGMHPWMNPVTETKLWPHECSEIYQAYHTVFDCFTHGWSNVQSVHLNLPFATDEEFSRLHAAVRLILPILPALTASSPIVERAEGPWRDMRMQWVRNHCQRVPFLTGEMIPEPIFDEASYRDQIFSRLKREIEPFDPFQVFESNFLNARGAIARFDRGSIEIRVMDVQECPTADVAVCVAVIGVLKALVNEIWQPVESQQSMGTGPLSTLLDQVSAKAESAVITDQKFLAQFGVTQETITASELWKKLIAAAEQHEPMVSEFRPMLGHQLQQGSLATRIQRAVGNNLSDQNLRNVYQQLKQCLLKGQMFG